MELSKRPSPHISSSQGSAKEHKAHSDLKKRYKHISLPPSSKKGLNRSVDAGLELKEAGSHPYGANVCYDKKDLIGHGASSEVFLAVERKTGLSVALKVIQWKKIINNKSLATEIKVLKKLSHPSIIKLYDVFVDQTSLQLVLELAEGRELTDEILEREKFTEQDARDVMKKILEGVEYMHFHGVVHRDLKPDNIIFCTQKDGTSLLKIIDFGFAANCVDYKPWDTIAGTLGFKAPELFKEEPYTYATDMWSLGVITYILLCGFPPFVSCEEWISQLGYRPYFTFINERTPFLVAAIKTGAYTFPNDFWDIISRLAKQFVSRLLQVNMEERMSATESLHHPWITEPALPQIVMNSKVLAQFKQNTATWTAILKDCDDSFASHYFTTRKENALRLSTEKAKKIALEDDYDDEEEEEEETREILQIVI
eukprot:TRINITY_DN5123_c0_g1_i1.p1 TRINITY_DN5123_c0_g1~~TRINITY_DN5123_c0_g1_i1.p1  ORF type:complete len:437 (-),score=58.96 TRINITY_DN5123_c0_g1_i1:207-1484(-)